jgi:hypothetical protein
MEDKINKYNNNPDYDAGYEEGWDNAGKANYNRGYDDGYAFAIQEVLDILKQMGYNNPYITPTLKEVEQRLV